MNNTFYYACSYPLQPGSVVQPGNWGRILRHYPLASSNGRWRLLREMIYENIRLAEFSNRPSRMDAIFLCESLDNLQSFCQRKNRSYDLFYKVALTDPAEPLHRGCTALFEDEKQGTIETLQNKARVYWSGELVQWPEIVTTSGIEILAHCPVA